MKLSIVSDGRPPSSRALHKAVRAVLLSLLIIFVCATAFCGCVSADGSSVDQKTASSMDELEANLTGDGDVVVTLTDNIYNGSFWTGNDPMKGEFAAINISSGNKTLDLNGHNINLNNSSSTSTKANDYFILFNIANGSSLTIKNNGTNGENYIAANVTAMIVVSDGSDFTLEKNVNLTTYGKPNLPATEPKTTLSMVIGILAQNKTDAAISDVKLDADSIVNDHSGYDNVYAIYIVQRGFLAQNIAGPEEIDKDACGVNLEINGKVNGHRGILLHGYVQNVNPSAPNVTINDGAEINASLGSAIVTCGYGNWNFNGGKVTGHDALMIYSGKFTITGGDFSGNGEYVNVPSTSAALMNDGGEQNTSAAITVVGDKQFIGNVSITITGGTFTSKNGYAFYENDTKINEYYKGTALNKVYITGGTFTGNKSLYPMYILMNGEVKEGVHVSLNDQTPCYPGLNTSLFTWVKDTEGQWTVTFNQKIQNLENINLSLVKTGSTVKIVGAYGKIEDGYTTPFVEWRSSDGKIYQPNAEEIPVGFVYTPSFEKTMTFNVKFNPNGGTEEMPVQTFISGKELALSENKFVKENYEFAGWAEEEKGPVVYANKQVITIDKNKDLYAVWNAIKAPAKNVNASNITLNETAGMATDLNVSSNNVTITKNITEIDQGIVNVTITYSDEVLVNVTDSSVGETKITGNITKIEAKYDEITVPKTEAYTEDSKVYISIEINASRPHTIAKLPTITAGVNQTKANQLLAENADLKIVSMIEGTSEINENISMITLEFKVNKTWVDGINEGGKDLKSEVFKAWHIPDDGSAIKEDKIESVDTTSDGYYLVKVTSEYGFSAPTLTATPSEKAAVSGGSSSTSDDNYYDDDDSSSSTTTTPTPTVTPTVKPTQIPTEVPTETPTLNPVEPTEEQPTAAPTQSPMPVLGLLMGLCVTALVLRRK